MAGNEVGWLHAVLTVEHELPKFEAIKNPPWRVFYWRVLSGIR